MSLSTGNDAPTVNGQPTILVKDAKVTPSTEFHGAVTRAKDSKFGMFYKFFNVKFDRFATSNNKTTATFSTRYWFICSIA
jgi:hypothetical protein